MVYLTIPEEFLQKSLDFHSIFQNKLSASFFFFWNREPLKVLNDTKLIQDDQGDHFDSFLVYSQVPITRVGPNKRVGGYFE